MEKSADPSGNEGNMAPKNNPDPINPSTKVDEADLQEMEAVNDSLDELSNALDFFEQRTDNIIEQLKELLHSNQEIRQQLAQEKLLAGASGEHPSRLAKTRQQGAQTRKY